MLNMKDPETNKPKVLYVDDAKEHIALFTNSLSKDFKIFTAGSGEKGMDIMEKENVQVVISDQRMPGMSGDELLEMVATAYPDVLRFMISGFTDYKAIVDGVNKGQIQGYFRKPIEPEEIRIAINKGLEIANLRKRNTEILQELESANTALKNADRNKTLFLQILSNELIIPLNEVRATVQVFKNKSIPEDLKNLVNLLDQNVSKFELLSSLANQITQLKVNDGKLTFEGTNTREVLEYFLTEISEKLKRRKVKIELVEENPNLLFNGDFDLVISCLVNIIDNALDHTPDAGKITVKTGEEGEMIYFEVIDGGMDYSDEHIKSIRDFFFTNKEELNLDINLGLVLAKQIMDVHHGKVECSCGEKKGGVKLLFHSSSN